MKNFVLDFLDLLKTLFVITISFFSIHVIMCFFGYLIKSIFLSIFNL